MTDLTRQVKNVVLLLNQIGNAMRIPHVGDVDMNPAVESVQVEWIAAIFGNQRVHDNDARAQLGQSVDQVAADKAHAARNQNVLRGKRSL